MNPRDLLDQHCGDLHRVAVTAAEKVGWAFVPGGTEHVLPMAPSAVAPGISSAGLYSAFCGQGYSFPCSGAEGWPC